MKKLRQLSIYTLAAALVLGGCKKLDRLPETDFSDVDYWNTESDLINAANRMYEQLDGNWIDNRGDDNVAQGGANGVSNGTRTVPNTSADWNDRYDEIFTCNNILEKGTKAKVAESVMNRYFGEARFFRAYAYIQLVQKYGDVPLVLHTLARNSPELEMPRSPRADVMKAIYEDLDFAGTWLPTRSALPAAQYGRVTKSAALSLKARIALYEGTREKFRNESGWEQHLQLAVDAAQLVMAQGHNLFANYGNLFTHVGEGPANTENIFVKIYGVSSTNLLLGHNNARDLENGRIAITRNLIRQYLYTDGLPAFNNDNTPVATPSPSFIPEGSETTYNAIFANRDPRLTYTVFLNGETAYKGPWVPTTSLGARSAFATKKGFNLEDWTINGSATVDRILIRYGEILLIYAEAKFELAGTISDADLDLSINKLRTRAGMAVKLTNAFVTTNNLNMREEIRRERSVELALEGFRYDDLIRWKTAEIMLPKDLLGAKFIAVDWPGTTPSTLKLNADNVLIAEAASTRTFLPARDYLYPVPLNEISLSGGNVTQNPNWQ
ncbi:MAG TPA: RagB/SusD family nutrient uptake outer membrane protein [Chitinophagaceae bacterium]|nr:RagB/SusD family nutrient uptake outer membrane protein [Chitinophagaceae bacterium]